VNRSLLRPAECPAAVGGVADEVNRHGGEGFCDLVEEVAAEVGFAAATFDPQGEQDGQYDRAVGCVRSASSPRTRRGFTPEEFDASSHAIGKRP